MTQSQAWERGEPSVEELLSDPILDSLARQDGLTLEDVRYALEAARRRLKRDRDREIPSAAA